MRKLYPWMDIVERMDLVIEGTDESCQAGNYRTEGMDLVFQSVVDSCHPLGDGLDVVRILQQCACNLV